MSTDDPRTPELPDDDGVDAELASTLRRSLHEAGAAVEPTLTWGDVADRLDVSAPHRSRVTAPRVLVAFAAAAALLLGAVGVLGDADDDQTLDVGADPAPSAPPAAAGNRSIVALRTDGRVVLLDPATGEVVDDSWSQPIPDDLSAGDDLSHSIVGISMTASPTPPLSLGTGIEEDAPGPAVAISTEGDLERECESVLAQVASDGSTSTTTRATAGTYSLDGASLAFLALEMPDMHFCRASIVVADRTHEGTRQLVDSIRIQVPVNFFGELQDSLMWASDGEHLAYNAHEPYDASSSGEQDPQTTAPHLLDVATAVETDLTPDPADLPDDVVASPDVGWEVIGVKNADTYWLRGICFFECANVHWILAVDGDDVTAVERDPAEGNSSIDPASGRLLFTTITEIACTEAPCDPPTTWHVAQSISSDESIELDDVVAAAWGPPLPADVASTATTAPPHPTPGDGPQVTDTTWAPSQTAIEDCVQLVEEGGAVVSDDKKDLPPAAFCVEMLTLAGPGVVVAPVGPCPPGGMVLAHGIEPEASLPGPVDEKRLAIFEAAKTCDWEGLEALMADDFTWSFGDEPGAASARSALEDLQAAADTTGERGPLQLIVGLLSLDPWDRDGAWTWPAQMGWNESAFVEGHPDMADLGAVIGDEAIAQLIDQQTYLGWRLVILTDGTWSAFVAGD